MRRLSLRSSSRPTRSPLRGPRWIAFLCIFCGSASAQSHRELEVRETAGIRRFGYPVSAHVALKERPPRSASWRLLLDGKPVEAQIEVTEGSDGALPVLRVDFEASLLPLEVRRYTLDGPGSQADTQSNAAPLRGLRLEETPESFRVLHGDSLAWVIPKAAFTLIRSVQTREKEFLRPTREGRLELLARDGTVLQPEPSIRARALRRGPIACTIELEGFFTSPAGAGIQSRIELELCRSKSWVRARWSIDDPRDLVGRASALHELLIESEPLLADFGAVGLVYAAVGKGQGARFRSGARGDPPWEVLRGPAGALEPYVTGRAHEGRAEGWAHFMDSRRCTALAVADFGKASEDSIEVESGGKARIERKFPDPAARDGGSNQKKEITWWLHFVDMPPHVGAVTSPQAMMAPLETRWIE